MGIADFLSSVAVVFRNRYLEMARTGLPQPTATDQRPDNTGDTPQPAAVSEKTEPVDRYVPSGERTAAANAQEHEHIEKRPATHDDHDDEEQRPEKQRPDAPADGPAIERTPAGTYAYRRKSRLDFRLDLRFDLAAISRTAERLSDGDTTAVDEFVAAGFGFRAGFSAKGSQTVIERAAGEGDDAVPARQESRSAAFLRSAGRFAAQSRDFAVQAFYREAASVKRTLDVTYRDGFRRTVNRFAMRFRMDSRFDLGFARRFTVQTARIADQAPDQTGPYIDSAGRLAAGGSNELLSSFFDAVDSYLDQTEDRLVETVTAFFERAQEELGFSEGLIDIARERVLDSVAAFFDRVEGAIDRLESNFGVVSPAGDLPVSAPEGTVPPTDATATEQRSLLAVA